MSDQPPPGGPAPTTGSEIPPEYSDAYQRAYRRSLAEHPTELLSAARPGKRAAQETSVTSRLASMTARSLMNPRTRAMLGVFAAVTLVALSFALGRLLS